jgi:hypothetical protein
MRPDALQPAPAVGVATRFRIGTAAGSIGRLDSLGVPEMDAVYFALVAILLYFVADWALRRIESAAGRTLQHRSLVFFALLLTLAVVTFAIIRRFVR